MAQTNQDRRRANRVKYSMPAPLSISSGSSVLNENSSTIDISNLGIRLRLHGQREPGSIVEVFLINHPEQCRVVGTSPSGVVSKLIAGLEFIRPLPIRDDVRRLAPEASFPLFNLRSEEHTS